MHENAAENPLPNGTDTANAIKEMARRLDEAIESKDVDGVVSCFAEDCTLELLGVRLNGRAGVRRWLEWLLKHISEMRFEPRVIIVDADKFVEEFVVHATLYNGIQVRSHQAELLTYRNGLVTSLRLYFNPLDFAPAVGISGRLAAPLLAKLVRKGLRSSEEIDQR